MIYSKIDLLKKEIDTLRPFSGELLCSIKKYYKIGLIPFLIHKSTYNPGPGNDGANPIVFSLHFLQCGK